MAVENVTGVEHNSGIANHVIRPVFVYPSVYYLNLNRLLKGSSIRCSGRKQNIYVNPVYFNPWDDVNKGGVRLSLDCPADQEQARPNR